MLGRLWNKLIKTFNKNHNVVDSYIMPTAYISPDSVVGEYTYVGYNTFISKATIGRYCSIANNVSVGHGEHLIDKVSTSSLFYESPYDILTAKDCVIGNDVWLGVGSTIRRGIIIGNGAIIGANSFVNKDVPPYAIVGGVPAKLIRYRFTNEHIRFIENSKWWKFDIDEAKKMIKTIEETIELTDI